MTPAPDMWECDPQVTCDGHYLTNTSHAPGSATFSENFVHLPHIVFSIHVVDLGEGFKMSVVSQDHTHELLSVCSEGRVAASQPICRKDSRIAVQIDRSGVLIYVDDLTLTHQDLETGNTAQLRLTLSPGAALLFDMSVSLSNIATSVTVLRKHGLTYSNPNPFTYNIDAVSNAMDDNENANIIFNRVMSAKYHFYQLKITECGPNSAIGIGLANQQVSPYKYPGWEKKTLGYHSDDGILFKRGQHDKALPKCTVGDVMGCGIRFVDRDISKLPTGNGDATKGEKVTVYFTKNGEVVGETPMFVPEGGLYPTIGISDGDRICVDFAAVSG